MGIYIQHPASNTVQKFVDSYNADTATVPGKFYYRIDMSSLDFNTWYPVVFEVNSFNAAAEFVLSKGYSDYPPGSDSGSFYLRCKMHGSSWGGNSMLVSTEVATESYRRMCLGWGWVNHGGLFCVMLRGRYVYHLNMDKPISFSGINMSNFTETNSGYGPQIITAQTKTYDSSDNQYDLRIGPTTNATATNITNQDGYWNGTSITTPICSSRYIETIGGYSGA
jgi:hypothetical protein